MTISEIVRKHINEKGYSVSKIRKETNLGSGTLDSLLNANANPTIKSMVKIAILLDIDMNEFKEIDEWK
ncbi:helix-turn-helix domain-containing protein [Weissella soli]|uniref:helix-turn-helix domain-containing protein n=1 Tax=Weissella soli TaxID=155866 RepID=UPI003C7598E8